MNTSPLLLESPEYVTVEVRAFPHLDEDILRQDLPVSVGARVVFSEHGTHFAMLRLWQKDKAYAYTYEIQLFAGFKTDKKACREQYKSALNPAVIATNVARILYSGAREMLLIVSSRGPHGAALLPSIIIEPSDIDIEFDGDRNRVLQEVFEFTEEQIDNLDKSISESQKKAKSAKRTKRKAPASSK